MIKNKICAYCRVKLVKAENQKNSKSSEHLIPNAATNRKRKNDEADFYVCRECNAKKSKIDNILGKCAKIQGKDEDIAVDIINKEKSKKSALFNSLRKSAAISSIGPTASMPIKHSELIEYMKFLGKGQFLKQTGEVYDPEKNVMQLLWANKQIMSSIENNYVNQLGSNPFEDIKKILRLNWLVRVNVL